VLDGRGHLVGHFIPGEYRVGVNLVVVHYDKLVFGEDANKFNPSRGLDPKDAVMVDKYMIHFGAGLRFTLKLADPKRPWKIYNA
jgi:hypothetical protein